MAWPRGGGGDDGLGAAARPAQVTMGESGITWSWYKHAPCSQTLLDAEGVHDHFAERRRQLVVQWRWTQHDGVCIIVGVVDSQDHRNIGVLRRRADGDLADPASRCFVAPALRESARYTPDHVDTQIAPGRSSGSL